MIISVYLYKNGVQIYTYKDGDCDFDTIKFPEIMIPEVKKILDSFIDKNESLNIRTFTAGLSLRNEPENIMMI